MVRYSILKGHKKGLFMEKRGGKSERKSALLSATPVPGLPGSLWDLPRGLRHALQH